MIEKSIAWLGDDFPSEIQMPMEEDFHHDLLSETYEAITHAIDAHGSESKEYLDASCKIYGKKLLSYWASFMRSLQSQVAPKRRAKYQLKVDKVMGEKTLEYEKLSTSGKKLYLKTTEGNLSFYIDSNQIPRMDIYMSSGDSISPPYDCISMRVLNGRIDDNEGQKIRSTRKDVRFEVTLRMGSVNSITKDALLPGGIRDARTITDSRRLIDLMT